MIKEALADVLGLGGHDWSDRLGDAAAEVLFAVRAFPDAVAEGWWRGARRERALSEFAGAAEVFCYCDPQLAGPDARRHGAGRHPVHRDMISPRSSPGRRPRRHSHPRWALVRHWSRWTRAARRARQAVAAVTAALSQRTRKQLD